MSTLKTSNIANLSGTSTSVENVLNGTAKAWVNFNGTGTVAIRASFNVSSITDNGTGNYTVNFTTAMVDANYSVGATCQRQAGDTNLYPSLYFGSSATQKTTSFALQTRIGSTYGLEDATVVNAQVFR